ncbi:response regulator transcription factor [Microbacterium sp. M3]|uniref:Response regulator transcription factor n=1 Tax=Microbacterium arthrosphaerae TaxID=792652 RepID=A0ABU4H4P4_9MICO|nr:MULTISPECIES: response regulator transcription factor [Microbacterium]MDW4574293.1 response regulator transcription factor [Microbacterium arthrosphaerae]MDW7608148.1 response regulator transcription factor [Microbacterium sp. M3]
MNPLDADGVAGDTAAAGRGIRVLIVDDHALVRSGIRGLLEAADLVVVGEASNGQEAVAAVRTLAPDVVLMDIRMPGMDGIEATGVIAAGPDAPRVLVLTTFDLDEYVYRALAAGASGFLLKDAPPERLVDAVRTVAAGEALLAPEVTRRLIERYLGAPPPDAHPPVDLTPREQEIWLCIARGRSNLEIGQELYLSEATVKAHVTRLLSKLGVRDRVQAVVAAYETGLVRPGA